MQACQFYTYFLGEKIPCYYIKDKAQAVQALNQMMEQDILFAVDTETEALPSWHARSQAALSPHLSKIRLIQTYNNKAVCVFDTKFIDAPEIFIPFLEAKRFIAHNALFDLQFFMRMGVKSMNIGCTYQLAKLMFHASRPDDAGLKGSLEGLCLGLFNQPITKANQMSDWSVPELTYEQVEYSALDAVAVMKVAEKLARVVTGYQMERYYQLCKDAQHPIAHMQLNGIGLDTNHHRELIDIWMVQLNKGRKEVVEVLGQDKISAQTIGEWLEKNLEAEVLSVWPRTDSGKLQTDAHAFADFAGVSPIIQPFANFQKIKTLTSNFGNKLLGQVNPETGRVHPSFRLNGARTGRLSCTAPNLQQLPKDKQVRSSFIAEEGKVFLCADYSQVELRVAAELSQDPVMLEAYRQGVDLHSLTAAKVSGKPMSKVTKADRQMAKCLNFGLLFGLGIKKFGHYAKKSYNVEVTLKEAEGAIKAFRETYAGYYAWQKQQVLDASESLTVRTPCGKLRRLDPENTYGTAMNHPVQGGAAECMLYALIELQRHLNGTTAKLVNCVHDEVIVECEPQQVEAVSDAINSSMVYGFRSVFPRGVIRGLCEVGVGVNWGEAKA